MPGFVDSQLTWLPAIPGCLDHEMRVRGADYRQIARRAVDPLECESRSAPPRLKIWNPRRAVPFTFCATQHHHH